MAELEAAGRKRNFYQFRPPIFDYEFRREGDEIVLAFSAKVDVPRELLVRLYETRSPLNRMERRLAVAADSEQRLLGEGFAKSNRFFVGDGVRSLEQVATAHGFDGTEPLLESFRNRLLKQERAGKLLKGDLVFVPQLADRNAVPLGPVLPVEDVSESVPEGGHRHQARWNIAQNNYDALDPDAWLADSLMVMGPSHQPVSNVLDRQFARLWLPQFAVLNAAGALVDVSPTPPEIVQQTEYNLTGDDPHVFAVTRGKGSRFLDADASSVAFGTAELPLGAYGAIKPA